MTSILITGDKNQPVSEWLSDLNYKLGEEASYHDELSDIELKSYADTLENIPQFPVGVQGAIRSALGHSIFNTVENYLWSAIMDVHGDKYDEAFQCSSFEGNINLENGVHYVDGKLITVNKKYISFSPELLRDEEKLDSYLRNLASEVLKYLEDDTDGIPESASNT
jgi:hypothetical protein